MLIGLQVVALCSPIKGCRRRALARAGMQWEAPINSICQLGDYIPRISGQLIFKFDRPVHTEYVLTETFLGVCIAWAGLFVRYGSRYPRDHTKGLVTMLGRRMYAAHAPGSMEVKQCAGEGRQRGDEVAA